MWHFSEIELEIILEPNTRILSGSMKALIKNDTSSKTEKI